MSVLYFCRHGIAEEAKAGQEDAERKLTAEGEKKFRKAAAGIARVVEDEPPKLILSSPLVRARETAEILAQVLEKAGMKLEIRLTADLGPGGKLGGLLKTAAGQPTVAVGHEPLLSEWIAELCFHGQGGLGLEMKKGALAAMDVRSARSAKLLFLLPPAVLRRL
ncbi:MAG TPA: histidine phosphatase family protein [Phycisphaerae bacterium]|nr:histidine phosphatase family protein [Phycisphaerae bacterium]